MAGPVLDALVAGAGPAGSAAARALALAGARVLLCDARSLPRHRLCGEFVSPEAEADIRALGLDWTASGARALHAVRIASGTTCAEAGLSGWAVTRHRLDAWLAESAIAAGAVWRAPARVVGWSGDARNGFEITLEHADARETVHASWIVGAFGRQPVELRPSTRAESVRGRIAVKAHVTGVAMPDRVELHAIPGGYIGLAPVGDARINVCAVVRAERSTPPAPGAGGTLLHRLVASAPRAAERLASGQIDPESQCAASGLRFGNVLSVWRGALLCGDAASLPHPLAGDGIAMALRAGRLAASCIGAALGGRIEPESVARLYAREWRREFAARLRWDAPLHALLERPRLARPAVHVLRAWPGGLSALVERTRGAASDATVERWA